MGIVQAITLGVVQGLTEFLPVSSSGHLIFLPHIFGWTDQGITFDVVLHLGTLVAVTIYFRRKLYSILKEFFKLVNWKQKFKGSENGKLGWFLLLSIIPAGIFGLLFGDSIETHLRSTHIVAFSLIFWGILLFVADWFSEKNKQHSELNVKRVIWIACAQALALIPGTSRSGVTMTAGLFGKLSKKDAAEFSFLMSVPIIFLAGSVKVLELLKNVHMFEMDMGALFLGFLASAVSGFFAIGFLLKMIQKWSFKPFALYRVGIGILILFFL